MQYKVKQLVTVVVVVVVKSWEKRGQNNKGSGGGAEDPFLFIEPAALFSRKY